MKHDHDWKGQNHPKSRPHDGWVYPPLPVFAPLLEIDDIHDFAPFLPGRPRGLDWDKVYALELDLNRYGCVPCWFPQRDAKKQLLTPQGQVDRFLFLLDFFAGGLPDDHTQVNLPTLTDALLQMYDWRGWILGG